MPAIHKLVFSLQTSHAVLRNIEEQVSLDAHAYAV